MKNISAILLLCILISGCGSNSVSILPTVHAAPAPTPSSNCDANGACFVHLDKPWGYCHIASNQTDRTFSGGVEIGINQNIADANDSLCNIPLAFGGQITSISGNVSYKSFNSQHPASMAIDLRSCSTDDCPYPSAQEHLIAAKFGSDAGTQTVIPYYMKFDEPISARRLMLVFNDDLAEAKPTGISISFTGTLARPK